MSACRGYGSAMHRRRNLVLCFDGTWNSADGRWPTNVVRTFRAVAPWTAGGAEQLRYYDRGVGTGRFDRVRGGIGGLGLARNVEQSYVWLSGRYRLGDRLFLLGYSRGAYTARSLAGLIGLCGIPAPDVCASAGRRVTDVALEGMSIYRLSPGAARRKRAGDFVASWTPVATGVPGPVRGACEAEVHFVGVWDTVGALGVPIGGLHWLGARRHRFHDVSLGRHVRYGYHAVAVDERRQPFAPALWRNEPEPGQRVEQVWFPGVHGDVGGGGGHAGLSDGALLWMWSKAWAAGLALRPEDVAGVRPDPFGVQGDCLSMVYRVWGPYDRPIGERCGEGRPAVAGEAVHLSAVRRLEASEMSSYGAGVAGRTLAPALERGLVAEASPLPGEEDPGSIAWEAPEAR